MLLRRKTVSTIKMMFAPCSKIGFKLLSSMTLNSKVPTSPGRVEIFTKSWIGLCVMVNSLTKYTENMCCICQKWLRIIGMCLLNSVKLKLFQKLINHYDSYQLGSRMRSLGNLLIQIGILILPMWIWFETSLLKFRNGIK